MVLSSKRDFGTLDTRALIAAGLARPGAAGPDGLARIALACFDDYYARSRRIPELAKRAFETRDWRLAIELSQERIGIYSVSIAKLAEGLAHVDQTADPSGFWARVQDRFEALVHDRYEADLALAYLDSLRRALDRTPDTPRSFRPLDHVRQPVALTRGFAAPGRMTPELVRDILRVAEIAAPFRDLDADAVAVAGRVNAELAVGHGRPLTRLEVVKSGFYRNRGAYVIGAVEVAGGRGPLALALLNRDHGLEVDAVIVRSTTLSHVFSSTLANFHVGVREYHELVDFLHELMPIRPRGQHYSTIGYNHVGKLAVHQQIGAWFRDTGGALDHAPGYRGSVAIGFTAPDLPFVLKVIRDAPTDQYKWGAFAGRDAVLAKYGVVHEYNRSGSMLDNIIFTNVLYPRAMFAPTLLDEVLADAAESVAPRGGDVFFRHLIVQRKLVPMPLYLASCTPEQAELVVIRLGQCIRNNAATNVFNRDLDLRNYGVSSLRFVYLFDYDAVDRLTDIKVRTNAGREEGEEDVPDWFFEDGVVFLPEELEAHLRLPTRGLRRLFRQAHGELLTLAWWERMQGWLAEGRVPRVRTYPRSTQLDRAEARENLALTPPD
jgi:isocitrate dehydrogenase kinase/phosphatase